MESPGRWTGWSAATVGFRNNEVAMPGPLFKAVTAGQHGRLLRSIHGAGLSRLAHLEARQLRPRTSIEGVPC